MPIDVMGDSDDVVIVGVGCRLPGADNLDQFWRVLFNGENHVIDIPKDRWNIDAFYDADPDAPGKTYVRKVGIVKDHDKFDNRLFDVNDIEAAKMDPQQRFVLESTFMALENAGIPRSSVSGSNTGVFMGLMNCDYTDILAADMEQADNYTLTGGAASIAAARVSYVFNLVGPALSIDTACSSALIAIHLASQALKLGDCDMAICGGVNCIMLPSVMIPLSKARMVSPTGASRAFSAEADGYARGEGCGIVILKKKSDAIANGDSIWATIKTASNQDGRMASPITAPSGDQQQLLLCQTYPRYGVDPKEIQYIEAHGTGTPVGDPIEANSLGSFFGQDGALRYIGSVKTNIGHLESAAGIAGLVKVLLMMKKATIAPSLHFVNPNPKIEFQKYNFKVPTECYPWDPLPDGRRLACVNSFGFGGSNGHAIITQYPEEKQPTQTRTDGHVIIAVSGHSKAALKSNVTHLVKTLSHQEINPAELSYTSTCRRDHYHHRLAVPVNQGEDALSVLKTVSLGSFDKFSAVRKKLNLVYVFGGMGTSWDGMCKGLMEREPKFIQTVREVDEILKKHTAVSVEKELRNPTKLTDPLVGPLALFACQVALFTVWLSWGSKPSSVVGQSVGEVAAAYASGRLSLKDAVMVIFRRTESLAKVVGGQMLAILNYPVSDVEELCLEYSGRLNVAVYYSPIACSISGDEDCVQAVKEILEHKKESSGREISLITLKVTTAFHSQRMDPLTQPLEKKLNNIKVSFETIPIYSAVTGKLAEEDDFTTPKYWAQNLRQPVLFYQALTEARQQNSHTVFVEIGPKPVLRAHLEDIFGSEGVEVVPSMERGSDIDCMLSSLCRLFSIGFSPRWESIVPQTKGCLTDEPKYQFQRAKLLYEPDISRRYRDGTEASIQDHPFVNRLAGELPTFKIEINERQTPFVFEHVVNGVILVPGAFYAEVAFAVGSEVMRMPSQTLIISAHYIQPLSLQAGQEYVLTCQVQTLTSTYLTYTVFKQNAIYAHGRVEKKKIQNATLPPLAKIRSRCKTKCSQSKIYEGLSQWGFHYGDGLSILRESDSNSNECLAQITSTDLINDQMYTTHLHPSVLDAMTQAISTIGGEDATLPGTEGKTILPAGLGSVTICQSLQENMLCYAKCVKTSKSKFMYNLLLMTQTGTPIAEVRDFVIKVVGENSSEVERVAFALKWEPAPPVRSRELEPDQVVITITDDNSIINSLMNSTEALKFIPCHNFDIEKIKECVFIQEGPHTLILKKEITALVFHQGATVDKTSDNADKVFKSICQTCKYIRELMIFLSEYDMTLPVTILTRSTQTIPSGNGHDVNIYGSQLWGMVRSMLKEELYPHVQLVDIADVTKETIHTLIDHIIDQNVLSNTDKEIAISNGTAYAAVVSFSREVESSHLAVEQKWEGDKQVRLMQAPEKNSGESRFCLRYETENCKANGHTKVELKAVLLHRDTVFPATMASHAQVWSDVSSDDSQLLCLEAEGRRETNTDFENVVVCLPVPVTNVVNVPPECVILKSLIPGYKVGLMTLLSITWNILEVLNETTSVLVIVDEAAPEQGKLMSDILVLFGREKSMCTTKESLASTKLDSKCSIVLLAELELSEIHSFAKSQQLQQIIALEGCIGDITLDTCFMTQTETEIIRIGAKQVFQLSKLRKNLPKIIHAISKRKSKSHELFKNINQAHFHAFSSGVLDLQNTGNLKLVTTKECLFRERGSYLVVGGLGGLGWLTVGLIAEMGGGLVMIVSRKLPTEEMETKIQELKQRTGANIVCMQADISDQISLQKSLNELSSNYPDFPLKGVFQGAGILDDSFLLRMSQENFDRVCMPKILGTYNLHVLTKSLNLDYFVMHSSIVSIAGNAGQSNYGAANSFMDTFAYYRRSLGLAGQSINWGPLEVGMALNNEQIAQQLQKVGFVSLNEEQIKNCLLHALLSNPLQSCFMDFDWLEKQRHLYLARDIRPIMMRRGLAFDEDDSTRNIDLDLLKQLGQEERFAMLFEYTKEVIGQVLSIDSEDLEKDTELLTLGLDSMLAMTLANQLRRDLFVRVPMVKLLEETSIESLVTFLDTAIMTNSSDEDMESNEESYVGEMEPEMSLLQQTVYHSHKKGEGKHDVIFGAEIYLTIPAPLEWIKDVILTLLRRHEGMRTLYIADDNDVVRPHILEDLSNVNMLPLDSNDPNDLGREILKVSEKPFDLSQELPVRIICSNSKGQYNIGFIFHSICFDLKSINLFFEDFRMVALAKMSQQTIPTMPQIYVAHEMRLALEPTMQEMSDFWKSRVNMDTKVPLISFAGLEAVSEAVAGYHDKVLDDISSDMRSKIDRQISSWNVTLFQFLSSAYMLLLHLISGETTVALRTAVDTRLHIAKLRNVITRCVNGIPLVGDIKSDDTIQSFVVLNSKETSRRVSNGLYPGKLITENTSEESAFNMVRHSVVNEDMTGLQSVSTGLEEFQFSYFSNGPLKVNHETRLLIWSRKDKQNTCLQLDYLPSLLTQTKAQALLYSLFALIDYMVSNPQTAIKNIPGKMLLQAANKSKQLTGSQKNISPGSLKRSKILGNGPSDKSNKQPEGEKRIALKQPNTNGIANAEKNPKQSSNKTLNTPSNYKIGDRPPSQNQKSALNQSEGLKRDINGITETEAKDSTDDDQLKAVLSGPILKLNTDTQAADKEQNGVLSRGAYFMKATKQGWEHKVFVKLAGPSLVWGPSIDVLSRHLPLAAITQISLNSLNDSFILIFKTRDRRFYFSTRDREQAKSWIQALRDRLGASAANSSQLFVMSENFMLF